MEKKRSKIQSKQKERVIMIRKEINKIELKKTMGKKKKDESLSRITKKKRERTQIKK